MRRACAQTEAGGAAVMESGGATRQRGRRGCGHGAGYWRVADRAAGRRHNWVLRMGVVGSRERRLAGRHRRRAAPPALGWTPAIWVPHTPTGRGRSLTASWSWGQQGPCGPKTRKRPRATAQRRPPRMQQHPLSQEREVPAPPPFPSCCCRLPTTRPSFLRSKGCVGWRICWPAKQRVHVVRRPQVGAGRCGCALLVAVAAALAMRSRLSLRANMSH